MDHSKRKDLKSILSRKLQVEAAMKVEGRTGLYNPLLQKPVALEPVGPGSYPAGLGGYAYIGPPPDFGGSYGCFVDDQGRKQYGVKSAKQFSIYDGAPVPLHSEVSSQEREALLSQMDEMNEPYKCEHCRAELSVSAPIKAEKVHCPLCSSEMAGAVEKVKNCYSKLEEKEMSTKAKEPVKAEADLAKEAMKVESPKEVQEAIKAPGAADLIDPSNSKDASNQDSLKELDLDKETKVKSKLEAAAKRKERMEGARKAFQEKKRKSAMAALKARKEVKAAADAKKTEELRKQLRIMATFEPGKFADLKTKPNLSAICAEIEGKLYTRAERDQVRAELAAMADSDPAEHARAKKELEFHAPEILMDEPKEEGTKAADAKPVEQAKEEPTKTKEAEAAMPPELAAKKEEPSKEEPTKTKEADASAAPMAAKKDEKEEPTKTKEAEAAKPQDPMNGLPLEGNDMPMEAMKHEFLAALSTLKGEKIEMSLHGEEGADPFWNVTVDAEPVGRIHLADQENAETIRAGFVADSYANNLAQAMQQVGVEKMMGMTKARLFAHRLDDSKSMERVAAKAKLEAKAEFDAKIATMRQDFVRSVQTAMAASDKNFYPDQHELKGGIFTALAQLAIEPKAAVWAIEAGFEAAPQYFDFITQKAIDIMDMPAEARKSFEDVVKASGKVAIADQAQPEEESLRDRLVKASHNAIAIGEVVGGEDKEMIRASLHLSANRR